MSLSQIGSVVGGIGLFLIGMALLTDGLKVSAGRSPQDILGR
jgi:Na+/phosphate symporter